MINKLFSIIKLIDIRTKISIYIESFNKSKLNNDRYIFNNFSLYLLFLLNFIFLINCFISNYIYKIILIFYTLYKYDLKYNH